MLALCLDAVMLQNVNFMAINTWAICTRYPLLKQVRLGHSVHGTVEELGRDLRRDISNIHYGAGGINHMTFLVSKVDKTIGFGLIFNLIYTRVNVRADSQRVRVLIPAVQLLFAIR